MYRNLAHCYYNNRTDHDHPHPLRRLRLLESEGIISGYRAVLNAEQLGIELEAIVHLSLRQDVEDWHETFIKKVQGWPEVSGRAVCAD